MTVTVLIHDKWAAVGSTGDLQVPVKPEDGGDWEHMAEGSLPHNMQMSWKPCPGPQVCAHQPCVKPRAKEFLCYAFPPYRKLDCNLSRL